jgi:hypothetical protein
MGCCTQKKMDIEESHTNPQIHGTIEKQEENSNPDIVNH